MNTSFLKKYQPKYYSEFIIEKQYVNLLNTLQKMDNLNILIVGDQGCGKTSILEATINEYYKDVYIEQKEDFILYINNLKEQGIQYYRNELKTFCQTKVNNNNKKKFIVLDDIDHINEQSQQVFRNCLDKYSHNVNFICSCLNTQKVIDSIQSRCTLIKIKPIKKQYLKDIALNIRKIENINITIEAIDFIIDISNKSIRQILNNLEKFKILDKKIDINQAKKICTNISFIDLELLTKYCFIEKNLKLAIETIYRINEKGYSVMDILDCYFSYIKNTNLISDILKFKTIKILCKYISIFHIKHEHSIELVLFIDELIKIK
jgi:replication factor C subunit 2/4